MISEKEEEKEQPERNEEGRGRIGRSEEKEKGNYIE